MSAWGWPIQGAGTGDIAGEVGTLAVILVIISIIAMLRYRRTLD